MIAFDIHPGAYPFRAGAGVLATLADYAPNDGGAVLISDRAVFDLHGKTALDALGDKHAGDIIIQNGEEQKNMHTLNAVLDELINFNIGRGGWIAALGGGVVGDIAGFAASVYLRGVPVVQLPTTLLAQVDAAIGGKTGVNHKGGKNLIGAFHQPAAVLCDIALLGTLPKREYRAGLAEVVKYAMLGDAVFFDFLADNADAINQRDEQLTARIVGQCATMKAAIVAADPHEKTGKRALLNLGHTFAHAIENCAGYGRFLHGEAVAIGLVAAARLSQTLAGFDGGDVLRVVELLQSLHLPTGGVTIDKQKLLTAMLTDKKRIGGKHRVILMHTIGDAFLTDAAESAIAEAIDSIATTK